MTINIETPVVYNITGSEGSQGIWGRFANPTIHEDISLDGFATAKKAFEYCIQLHPN